jgi:uncharacterized protein YndB with AHSA1/START domain
MTDMSYGSKPQPAPPPPPEPPVYTPMWMVAIGWIISLLPGLGFLAIGIIKLTKPELMKPPEGSPDVGWQADAMIGLAILEVTGAVLYLFPYTAVLGAIVLTGYIGGAIATHVRIGDQFAPLLMLGVLTWLGLAFRDARLRNMLPIRTTSAAPAGPTGCFGAIGLLFLTLMVIVGLLIGIANSLPNQFEMSRSTTIDATPAEVFPHVNDFNNWKPWNPFTKEDPNIKITIEGAPGEGQTYKWSSEKPGVGVGSMKITKVVPNERIEIHLEFKEPYESTGNAIFTFKSDKNKTDVKWTMEGESPLVFKVMRSVPAVMDKLLGTKFEEGLSALKSEVESKKQSQKAE